MKRILLLFVFMSSFSLAWAQSSLSGQVVDKETGEELIGATVYIPALEKGAATDIYGKFFIKDVTEGTYRVEVASISYKRQIIEGVEIKKGNNILNVLLIADLSELEAVIVTSTQISNNQASLIALQRKALSVQDGISVGEIKKLGVSNAAESIKYITGASVEGGKYMVLRGLGDRYSLTMMNGVAMPSTDPYRNSTSLDMIPTDMIDNLVTIKTFTPDKPGNFTGGAVDIATKSLPEEFYLNVGISTSFNTESNLVNNFITDPVKGKLDFLGYDNGIRKRPMALDTYGEAIRGGNALLALNAAEKPTNSYQRDILDITSRSLDNGFDHKEISSPLNTGVNLSLGNRYEVFGKPLGLNFGISYDRSYSFINNGILGNGYQSGNDFREQQDLLQNKGSINTQVASILSLAYQFTPNHELSILNVYTHNGENIASSKAGYWRNAGKNVDSRAIEFIQRSLNNTQVTGRHYFDKLNGLKIDWVAGYVMSSQEEPDSRYFAYLYETNDEGQVEYSMQKSELGLLPSHYYRDLQDKQMNLKADFTLPLSKEKDHELKVGFSYSKKTREFGEHSYAMLDHVVGGAYRTFSSVKGDFGSYFSTNNSGDLGVITTDQGVKHVLGNVYSYESSPSAFYDGEEVISAVYGMAVFEVTDWFRVIAGARLEQTKMNASSQDPKLKKGEIDELDILPSVNMIFKLNDDMNIRAGYSRTLARPNMREISPFSSLIGVAEGFVNGNADLERTLVDNYDLRYEFYPNPGELLAVSAYYKQFDKPIVWQLDPVGSTPELKPLNVKNAKVYGIEAEVRKNLAFLAPTLENLVVAANISFIHSVSDKGDEEIESLKNAHGTDDVEKTRPFQGQSSFLLNLSINHNWERLQWDNSLSVNIFGKRLAYVSDALTSDVYEQGRATLNFVTNKGFGDHLSVSFKAKNLLNPMFEKKYDGVDFINESFSKGVTFSLGLSYKL